MEGEAIVTGEGGEVLEPVVEVLGEGDVTGLAAAVGMGLVSAWAIFRRWGVK